MTSFLLNNSINTQKVTPMKTRNLLLGLFCTVFCLGISSVKAQSIDTVCAGSNGVAYSVTNTSGSTYHWIVSGGTQASGTTSNSITVNWTTTAGLGYVKVVEENAAGCFGDTVSLDVRKLAIPTATISGADTVCFGLASSFTVTLTGDGPWDFTWSDGTTSTPVSNVTSSPYTVNISGINPGSVTTKTYTVTAVSNDFGCSGTTSGSATITTIPKPTTSAISH
jgi:hypothetical protein